MLEKKLFAISDEIGRPIMKVVRNSVNDVRNSASAVRNSASVVRNSSSAVQYSAGVVQKRVRYTWHYSGPGSVPECSTSNGPELVSGQAKVLDPTSL